LVRRYYQDKRGRLPLNPGDTDARWRALGPKPAVLAYKQHVLADDNGFILAQEITHSTARDVDPVPAVIDQSPIRVRILTADTGYSSGELRRELQARGAEVHIPLHTRHLQNRKRREGFHLRNPRELICPAGKVLRRSTYYQKDATWLYAARVSDCSVCSRRSECLRPSAKRRTLQLSTFEPEFIRASVINSTARHRRLLSQRKTVVEGVFSHLDQTGFDRTRRRGLDRVQAEGFLVALGHNVLKAVKHVLGPGKGGRQRKAPPEARALCPGLTPLFQHSL